MFADGDFIPMGYSGAIHSDPLDVGLFVDILNEAMCVQQMLMLGNLPAISCLHFSKGCCDESCDNSQPGRSFTCLLRVPARFKSCEESRIGFLDVFGNLEAFENL